MWDIELRLEGHAGPPGTVKALDAARLAGTVGEVVYRITREAAGAAGLGRAHREVERLAQTRVTGLSGPDTTVRFTVGEYDPEGTFPLDLDPFTGGVEEVFARIVTAMGRGERPAGITDTIAAATGDLVGALRNAAPQVQVRVGDRPAVDLMTGRLVRSLWYPRGHDTPHPRTVQGLLEMVDLHQMHFRLRDAEGRRIELHEIADPDRAARLVGEQVTVRGYYFPPVGSARPRMEDVVVHPVDDAEQLPFGFVAEATDAATFLFPMVTGETRTADAH